MEELSELATLELDDDSPDETETEDELLSAVEDDEDSDDA